MDLRDVWYVEDKTIPYLNYDILTTVRHLNINGQDLSSTKGELVIYIWGLTILIKYISGIVGAYFLVGYSWINIYPGLRGSFLCISLSSMYLR